jgi:hypothetical protein
MKLFPVLALAAAFLPPHLMRAQERGSTPGERRFDRVVIEALDPDAWNGVVFMANAYQQQVSFALRVGSRRDDFLDGGEKMFSAVSEVGPHAPDASYCRVSWRHPPRQAPVTLEWSRRDATTVVGRVTSTQGLQLVLETYFPSPALEVTGTYAVDESRRAILGERYFDKVFNRVARLVVMTDRPLVASGAYTSVANLHAAMDGPGRLTAPLPSQSLQGAAGLEFADSTPAHFVAILGWELGKGIAAKPGERLAGAG